MLKMDVLAQKVQQTEDLVVDHEEDWRGLSFVVGGRKIIASTSEITEIVEYPESMTVVPNTPDWMVGLAHFHGDVLTVSDLQCFLGGVPTTLDYQSKILVVKYLGKYFGFLVPSVLGLRYLPLDRKREYSPLDNIIDTFIYEVFDYQNQIWPVISFSSVLTDRRFMMD